MNEGRTKQTYTAYSASTRAQTIRNRTEKREMWRVDMGTSIESIQVQEEEEEANVESANENFAWAQWTHEDKDDDDDV